MTRKRDELLDHDTDGIHEFDNDLPRWWLYGFYFTIAFAAVYLVNYHVLPTPVFGERSIVAEYEADVRTAGSRASRSAPPTGAAGSSAAVIAALTDRASLDAGKAIFESQINPCFACHRPDLGGLVGPNLTDDARLHGCSIGELIHNIQTGFPQQGMVPYGGGRTLTDEQLLQVASYVLSRRGTQPESPKARDPERDKDCK